MSVYSFFAWFSRVSVGLLVQGHTYLFIKQFRGKDNISQLTNILEWLQTTKTSEGFGHLV